MNCEEVKRAWHDREAGLPMPADMEAHLRVCEHCHLYYARMNALGGTLDILRIESELPADPVQIDVPAKPTVATTPATSPARRYILSKWLPVAAVILAAVTVALWAWVQADHNTDSAPTKIARSDMPSAPVRDIHSGSRVAREAGSRGGAGAESNGPSRLASDAPDRGRARSLPVLALAPEIQLIGPSALNHRVLAVKQQTPNVKLYWIYRTVPSTTAPDDPDVVENGSS